MIILSSVVSPRWPFAVVLILLGGLLLFLMPEKTKAKKPFKPLSNSDIELLLLKKGWKLMEMNNVHRSYKPPVILGMPNDFRINIPVNVFDEKQLHAALLQVIALYQNSGEALKSNQTEDK